MAVSGSRILDTKINWNFEIVLTLTALLFTGTAGYFLMQDFATLLEEKAREGYITGVIEQVAFIIIVMGLIYGNIVYQLSRLGFILRDKKHNKLPATESEQMQRLFQDKAPSVTILVPSFREETRIIYQTLLSAALQQYPDKKVVLLIDDPSWPKNAQELRDLEAARALPEQIGSFLAQPCRNFLKAKEQFLQQTADGKNDLARARRYLALQYEHGATKLKDLADNYKVKDHTDRLFVEKILYQPAQELSDFARALRVGANCPGYKDIKTHYNRLIAIFTADLSCFERKRYENLSHEKNKAMNLNTYIGLIGKSLRTRRQKNKLFLEECPESVATLTVPDSAFIITLDADSLIVPDYALRLVSTMLKPGNEKLAVVQTPYSAVPDTENLLERIAGATTDIQLLIHQGFTWCGATFWVGANALLRKEALEDIKVMEEDRGYPVTRYIQDRTVIEDTESSIDLIESGWSLYNYPARMAYSATPPDYGSLLIQRRRWANGGLIILPKLIRHIAGALKPAKLLEAFIRTHYLASIALTSIGVLLLILYPFEEVMRSWWLPLTALPYFYLYARDLKLCGYKWTDLFRVYALNLMLVPINIGGVVKSIQQGVTKKKIPFVRTPKINNRTAAPPLYVLLTFAIFGYCLLLFPIDLTMGRPMHAAFNAMNAAFFGYASAYFLGWKEGWEDIISGWNQARLVKATRAQGDAVFRNNVESLEHQAMKKNGLASIIPFGRSRVREQDKDAA